MTRLLRLALSLLIAAVMAGEAQAARRIALVIGNGAYTAVSPLANPKNDADLMARTLESVGFEVTKLVDADQHAMKQAMLDFGRKLREGVDASLFYYSGHGVQANGENYLIPVDAAIKDAGELDLQAVDVNAFLHVMEGSASKINIVILDACRNNPFASSLRSASRGLAMVDAPRGTYIAYSTAPGDVAEDGSNGNSPYTAALAAAMVKPNVKLEEVFKDARRIVLAATDNKQVPWETTSITGDFFFVRKAARPATPPVPPAPAPDGGGAVVDAGKPAAATGGDAGAGAAGGPKAVNVGGAVPADEAAWQRIAASSEAADFNRFLQSFPQSRFAADARTRLASLAPGASGAEASCFAFVQGNIPWNQKGGAAWVPANIQALCRGTTKAAEPGRCFDRVMNGGVNWGGGTKWQWRNVVRLCQGTSNAEATVSCFEGKIAAKERWGQAIAECKATPPVAAGGAVAE